MASTLSYILTAFLFMALTTSLVINFGSTTQNWQVVNDTVMGGRSQSQVTYFRQHRRF